MLQNESKSGWFWLWIQLLEFPQNKHHDDKIKIRLPRISKHNLAITPF